MARLIEFSQIRNGSQALLDILTLQNSYDAVKVVTDILKSEGGATYNVNELLTELKNQIDEQLGGGGPVADQIADAVEALRLALQAQLDTAEGSILAINERAIKDRVRLTGAISYSLQDGLTANFAGDTAAAIEAVVESYGPYVVYGMDNRPLQNESGENITYNFTTASLSARPHVLDETQIDVMTYIPVVGDVNFKIFPVGSFTFETLPADYLLDNEELNLIAYSKAIDEIVFDLAKDGSLIAHIQSIVGEVSVQEQITLITNAIADRVTALESDLGALDTYVKNMEATTNYKINKILAVKEQLDVFVATPTTTTSQRPVLDGEGNPTVDEFGEIVYESYQSAPFITKTYALTKTPTAAPIRLFINGVAYRENDSFTVLRAEKMLTWTFGLVSGGFALEEGFELEVVYKYEEAVAEPELIV